VNLWYVIQQNEKGGRRRILSLDKRVEMFNPLMETFALRNGGMNKELKPLFPGYISANSILNRTIPWSDGQEGKNVLGFGGYPTSISEEVVKIIKEEQTPRVL